MSLLGKFLELSEEIGVESGDLIVENGEGFDLVTFGESVGDGVIYNAALVFYDDDDSAEIYIRKPIETQDEIALLRKLNELNAAYCGISFFVDEGLLNAKSYCRADGNAITVMRQLVQNMEIAKEEFPQLA